MLLLHHQGLGLIIFFRVFWVGLMPEWLGSVGEIVIAIYVVLLRTSSSIESLPYVSQKGQKIRWKLRNYKQDCKATSGMIVLPCLVNALLMSVQKKLTMFV